MQCAMIVGFLVPHRCTKPAMAACIKCGRQYCEEHVTILENGLVCGACQKGFTQPVLYSSGGQDFTANDLVVFSSLSAADTTEDGFSDLT